MRILCLLLIFLGFIPKVHTQHIIKNALLGTNHGIKLVGNKFVADTTYQVNTNESYSTLLDSNGAILLYSNEKYIYSKNHKLLNANHPFLGQASSAQGSFLYQHPERNVTDFFHNNGNYSQWYNTGLFHSSFEYNKDSIFNIRTDTIIHYSKELFTIIRHQNNKDLWILSHNADNSNINSTLLNAQGVSSCQKSFPIGVYKYGENFNNFGSFAFHPSGSFFIYQSYNNNKRNPILYSFNRQNGLIEKVFEIDVGFYSSIFSQIMNDSTAYFVHDTEIRSLKINIKDKTKTEQSLKTLASRPPPSFGLPSFGDIQKITPSILLVGNYAQAPFYGAIIHNSDTVYYMDTFVFSSNIKSNYNLPLFDESIFHTPSIDYTYDLDCRTNTIHFEGKDTFGGNTFKYIIKKQGNTIQTLTGNAVKDYVFADTGVFEVSYMVSNASNRADTVTKTIEVLPKIPANFLGNINAICFPDTAVLLKAPQGLHCYRWYNAQETVLGSSYSLKADTAGTYICTATDNNFCSVQDTVFLGIDTPKYNLKLQRIRDTIFCSNCPSSNNPQFHWYKNGNGFITLLQPKLTVKDTGFYSLIITQDSLCESYSDTLQIDTIYGPNSVFQIPIAGLKIYPNPAHEYLTIDYQGTEPLALQLFDALGKVVLSKTIQPKTTVQLDVSKLAKGIYLLSVNGNLGVKVILQ